MHKDLTRVPDDQPTTGGNTSLPGMRIRSDQSPNEDFQRHGVHHLSQ